MNYNEGRNQLKLVRLYVLAIVLVLQSDQSMGQERMDKRPNILFFIADDWGYPHAGIYSDSVVRTPNFDKVATSGMLFTHAFAAAPSCSASRASILTGQEPHRLEDGANLFGHFSAKFVTYPQQLSDHGYSVGLFGKGWGPGDFRVGGFENNPAGKSYTSFENFISSIPDDKPFCFWYGSANPHRPYQSDGASSVASLKRKITVPPWLPDSEEVRGDMVDYYEEIRQFDEEIGETLTMLERSGRLNNTIIVITSDNGMPFPRAKTNLYDAGVRVPLAIWWVGKSRGGSKISTFVTLTDFAATFLEAAGLSPDSSMTAKSLLPLLLEKTDTHRNCVFAGRERHVDSRANGEGFPARSIRTQHFLYIRNFRPERWPMGNPDYNDEKYYGDIDASPTKSYMMKRKKELKTLFDLSFNKRPSEELYDLRYDPFQMVNVVDRPKYDNELKRHRTRLSQLMKETHDPRVDSSSNVFDEYTYHGPKLEIK